EHAGVEPVIRIAGDEAACSQDATARRRTLNLMTASLSSHRLEANHSAFSGEIKQKRVTDRSADCADPSLRHRERHGRGRCRRHSGKHQMFGSGPERTRLAMFARVGVLLIVGKTEYSTEAAAGRTPTGRLLIPRDLIADASARSHFERCRAPVHPMTLV